MRIVHPISEHDVTTHLLRPVQKGVALVALLFCATGLLLWAAGNEAGASPLQLQQAQAAFDKKQYSQALELLDQLTKQGTASKETRRLRVKTFLKLGRPADALGDYEQVELASKHEDVPLLQEVAMGFITVLLKDMRDQMRGAAYTALKEFDSEEAVPYFEDGLSDGSGAVRVLAVEGLGRLESGRRSPKLRQALEDQAALVKAAAIKVLGRAGDRSVIPVLEEALKDEQPSVRVAACGALLRLGRKDAWEPLRQSAAAPNPDERAAALRVMGDLKETRGIAILTESLQHPQPSVRGAAARAIGHLGKPEMNEVVQPVLHDPVAAVRESAAVSLGEMGNKESVSALKPLLADAQYSVQAAAVSALLQLDQPYELVSATVLRLFQQSDAGARTAVAHSLGKAGKTNRTPALDVARSLAVDPLPGPRIVAVRALGHIGGKDEVPLLREALRDSNEAVRATAGGALGRLLADRNHSKN